jgi:hypothetical protein
MAIITIIKRNIIVGACIAVGLRLCLACKYYSREKKNKI